MSYPKMTASKEQLSPDHYKVDLSKGRSPIPVDFNLMYLSYCKEHPVDLLVRRMEQHHNMGLNGSCIELEDLMLNLDVDHPAKTITKIVKVPHKKFLFFKTWEKKEVEESNPEYTKFVAKLAQYTLVELTYLLHNQGFQYETRSMPGFKASELGLGMSAKDAIYINF